MILIVLDSSGFVQDSVSRTEKILLEFCVPDSGPDLKVPHKPGRVSTPVLSNLRIPSNLESEALIRNRIFRIFDSHRRKFEFLRISNVDASTKLFEFESSNLQIFKKGLKLGKK